MYNPAHFREERVEVLHQLIQQHRLATLVTLGADGLIANHMPLVLEPAPAPLGTLRGHLSRANSQWRGSLSTGFPALHFFRPPTNFTLPSSHPQQQTQRAAY